MLLEPWCRLANCSSLFEDLCSNRLEAIVHKARARVLEVMASLLGAQAGQQPQVSPVDMMVAEMKGMADIFFRMQASCYNKCIASVKEEKLSVGEMSCVDRCVNKFMDVHSKVGAELQAFQAQQVQAPASTE
ncbi:Tim10 [Symbiodinium sp. CCMP2456]|nr:Tim10 [Symbiodinium sp. CCMP2456]